MGILSFLKRGREGVPEISNPVMREEEWTYKIKPTDSVTYIYTQRGDQAMTFCRLRNGAWFVQMPFGTTSEDEAITSTAQIDYLNSLIKTREITSC